MKNNYLSGAKKYLFYAKRTKRAAGEFQSHLNFSSDFTLLLAASAIARRSLAFGVWSNRFHFKSSVKNAKYSQSQITTISREHNSQKRASCGGKNGSGEYYFYPSYLTIL
jgi:hypothetical protein